MFRFPIFGTVVWFAGLAAPIHAGVDLTKVDRSIAKEPTYNSKAPKYCLLVLGPEAKTRVWLVLDGDTLYVDRNANGELTEPGERIKPAPGPDTDLEEGVYKFECDAIQDGRLIHKNLVVNVYKRDPAHALDEVEKRHLAKGASIRCYRIALDVEMPGLTGDAIGGRVHHAVKYRDAQGFLELGSAPGNAPIAHLGGPWQITLSPPADEQWKVGRESDVALIVATPGLGAGATAAVAYEKLIPEDANPKLEIAYPPINAADAPLKIVEELKDRC
jgi:hypothetical protein